MIKIELHISCFEIVEYSSIYCINKLDAIREM